MKTKFLLAGTANPADIYHSSASIDIGIQLFKPVNRALHKWNKA